MKFEAFAEEWFEDYGKFNLKSTTYTRQRQLTKRVYEAIGHIRLDKITTRVIQKFINSLSQDGTNERTDNPCRRVTIPKGSKKERKILTIKQTEDFLKMLETAPLKWRTFFTLDIYSGMRRGEMLGLEWTHKLRLR